MGWVHLHLLAWTDGVSPNCILNSMLKRIISAPSPCKQLSSKQQRKAFKIQRPHTELFKVKTLPEHLQVDSGSSSGCGHPPHRVPALWQQV